MAENGIGVSVKRKEDNRFLKEKLRFLKEKQRFPKENIRFLKKTSDGQYVTTSDNIGQYWII